MGLFMCTQMELCTQFRPVTQDDESQGSSVEFVNWPELRHLDPVNVSFSGRLHVTELKSIGGCSGKGGKTCASVFSSNFSLADKITLTAWSLDTSSNLNCYCLCWGFTAVQTSANSSALKKRWLDKASSYRHEEWWGYPENPGGLHDPSWRSGNRCWPCPISAVLAQSQKGLGVFFKSQQPSQVCLSGKEFWLVSGSLYLLKSVFVLLVIN